MGGWADALFPKPETPDYSGLANLQGQNNMEVARYNTWASRPDQITPWGTSTWGYDPATDHWTNYQELDEQSQQNLDKSRWLAGAGLDTVARLGVPQLEAALGRDFTAGSNNVISGFDSRFTPTEGLRYRMDQGGPIQSGLDYSGAPAMPTADANTRALITQALYQQGANLLDPQFKQQQDRLDSTLVNQGITRGSEAWGTEQGNLDRSRTGAYNDLAMRAITGGGEEMARDFGLGMSARQQGVGEITQQGTFANAAQGLDFQQMLNALSAENNAVTTGYNIAGNATNLNNAGQGQVFNQTAQGALLPINILTAMLGAGQVTQPNVTPTMPAGQAAPAPIFDAGVAQGNANIGAQNSQNAAFGSFLSGLGQAGAAGIAKSDRRLKTNVVRVGELPSGLAVYEYDIEGRRERGVMADEAEKIFPAAVSRGTDGYLRVNYAMVR